MPTWKEKLAEAMPQALAREIDVFETEMELRRKGKIEEKVFAETRLRRGMYGQRYDNGQRHDGLKTQEIKYPAVGLTKGPETLWDAPGMTRIKIPMGKLSAEQMDVLADCADEYSDAILHVTTRQDIQLHFIHIDDAPDMMRRLAAANITTREACGNSVRNVTACPIAGVCHTEAFDVTPYANALAYFLLGHPDTMEFGRKFKIAFSGCREQACGIVNIHDLGAIAKVKGGKRLFDVYVGGGLGAVPHDAKLLAEDCTEEELLPLSQATCRVFGRLGEKKNRQRARVKFLVAKVGIEEFKRLVAEERTKLPPDPRWTAFLSELDALDDRPLKPPSELAAGPRPEGYEAWAKTNVYDQKQPGYATATVTLPLGDFTSWQARRLSDLARKYTGDTIRLTVEQNLVFRWVSKQDLPALYADLRALALGEAGASTITDVVACPGTDTCKLGISSSRGLAAELRKHLTVQNGSVPESVRSLRIKTSGCFNSCGQHHVADLGFLGVSRNVNGRRVPHFQLVLGGKWRDNGGAYGLAIGAVPSKQVPKVVERLTALYAKERAEDESFQDFSQRLGRVKIKKLLEDLIEVPKYELDKSFYSDWGDPREYTIGDMGVGECAGEIVPFVQFGLVAAEREVFEAQIFLDGGQLQQAAERAYTAMITAAKALVRTRNWDIGDDPEKVYAEFLVHFHETKLFHDQYAGDKFVRFLTLARERRGQTATKESAHHLIEEATLFVDAAHACYAKIGDQPVPAGAAPVASAPEASAE